MDYRATVTALSQGRDLEAASVSDFLEAALAGKLSEVQIATVLAMWCAKGYSATELTTAASELRARCVAVAPKSTDLFDTCGTGGGPPTFNLSTAAAFILAGAGVKVAKHGNRGVTSGCGSADVLEELGVGLISDPVLQAKWIDTIGIAFLFALQHHPAMRAVGQVRKGMEIRTIFNLLGPLANPAAPNRQMVGVYEARFLQPVAEALQRLGVVSGRVVHAQSGMDEIDPNGPTTMAEIRAGAPIRVFEWDPQAGGFPPIDAAALSAGQDLKESADIVLEALTNVESGRFLATLPGVCWALIDCGKAGDLQEARGIAIESVQSGAALQKLEALREATQNA